METRRRYLLNFMIFISMAMLAEQKSKQKWSEDPRNMKWSSDKERYGYQMLEKMGWANGKGLGKNKSGSTSHVKIKKRKQNLGLGAKECHDNDWIAQQADFNNLLSALQQHVGNAELRTEGQNKKAMLEVAKASRKRVFYKRFIRSKDTSQYSQKDMACIFGNLPSQSAPATPLNQSDDEVDSEDSTASCPTIPCNSTSGFVTYTSKQNIQEYFALRMRERQDCKGIEMGNDGEKGVCLDREGQLESKAGALGDGEEEDGIERSNVVDTSKAKKRGKSDHCSEIDSRKTKKRKKSKIDARQDMQKEEKCVFENLENNLCVGMEESSDKIDEKAAKKKSKRRKKKEIDDSGILENGVGTVEYEKKLYNEVALSKGSKIKTKKSKKSRTKDDSETIANCLESVVEENEKSLCDEDDSSFHGGDKVNTAKKNKKRRGKDGMLQDLDVSNTIENDMDNVPEQNEENISFRKEDRAKTKKSKKGKMNKEVKGLDGQEMAANGIEDDPGKGNLCEEQTVSFKQDKMKRKKNKTRTKRDNVDD